jgi:hypothetical protein
MKPFRSRKPSVSRMLGISSAKSKFTRATGGAKIRKPKSIITNYQRRMKRKAGYYSPIAKATRTKRLYIGPFRIF